MRLPKVAFFLLSASITTWTALAEEPNYNDDLSLLVPRDGSPPGTAIVGGENAMKGDFPYYATPYDSMYICGGNCRNIKTIELLHTKQFSTSVKSHPSPESRIGGASWHTGHG